MADPSTAAKPSEASAPKVEKVRTCQASGCTNPAKLQCPNCITLKLPPAHFCGQECFKNDWKVHNQIHKDKKAFVPWSYPYTGPLRPDFVTPMRTVPPTIPCPDYHLTGVPLTEQKAKAQAQVPIYTAKQIKGIRAACHLGRDILDLAHRMVKPGVTTDEIDRVVHEAIIERGAYPSPLNYNGFPKSCCTSVNEVICHGIPDCRELQDGDIVNVDISVYYKGYHGDLNETYPVGTVEPKHLDLIRATHDSLAKAIELVKPGAMIRDFGEVITKHVSKFGFSVVRSYCGHGIGELFHCAPNIPHYAKNKAIGSLKPGMIFTIEPMINEGTWRDKLWPDDWTSVTVDGMRSAQFEHQMLVTQTGVEVLTQRTKNSPRFFWETEESHAQLPDAAPEDDSKDE